MGKAVLSLSLFGLVILLFFGAFFPNNPVVWMASTSINFAILRLVLIAVLVGLLITNPPRNLFFRVCVGLIALGVTGWALSATYQNQMKFLDTLALLQVCVSAGLAVLERRPKAATIKVQYPPSPTWHLNVAKL